MPAAVAASRAAAGARQQACPPSGSCAALEARAPEEDTCHGATGAGACSIGNRPDAAAAQAADAERPSTPAVADGGSSGSDGEEALERHSFGGQRLALWAVELRLRHPVTGEPLYLALLRQSELARSCPELMMVDVET